jgi:para-aminobenzoate synthetase component I
LRKTATFEITDFKKIKQQMLNWANQFNICCFLDNHNYTAKHNTLECLLAVDAIYSFSITTNGLNELHQFCKQNNDWLFGHVAYDFKNNLEKNKATIRKDEVGFEDIFLFQPAIVIQLFATQITISSLTMLPTDVFNAILASTNNTTTPNQQPITITPKISKEAYISIINKLKEHIVRGDCYEINFCQEFFARQANINPTKVYQQLTQISPNPFACFYKLHDKYLLCASPERYVKKEGSTIISQPIKGTHKRDIQHEGIDESFKKELQNSTKDRSENVMVVDLVRNDLSKICKQGTVHVEELFGIYTFPQVHQMISTITGELEEGLTFADVLQATFPMGSMTGAPKKRVMELIDQYEQSKRGIYSGCVGYITPNGNFDFNVVIRSIMYNATNQYLSYQVGGGITFYSNAQNEYEECLLKAEAIKKVLQ